MMTRTPTSGARGCPERCDESCTNEVHAASQLAICSKFGRSCGDETTASRSTFQNLQQPGSV
jgi:hypothetical protein